MEYGVYNIYRHRWGNKELWFQCDTEKEAISHCIRANKASRYDEIHTIYYRFGVHSSMISDLIVMDLLDRWYSLKTDPSIKADIWWDYEPA